MDNDLSLWSVIKTLISLICIVAFFVAVSNIGTVVNLLREILLELKKANGYEVPKTAKRQSAKDILNELRDLNS